MKRLSFYPLCLLFLSACSALRESPKYQFNDGQYRFRMNDQPTASVYIDVAQDSIKLFPISKKPSFRFDSTKVFSIPFLEEIPKTNSNSFSFRQNTFDLDVLAIPFKYRPPLGDIPNQLNTDFNGALYFGYRSDTYKIKYQRTLLGTFRRDVAHLGYSVGVFGGIGSTAMNSYLTYNQISSDYDGVVFIKGIAGILAVDNFTFGLGIGVDHLLDQNRFSWVYQGKPWFGLTLGLNLN